MRRLAPLLAAAVLVGAPLASCGTLAGPSAAEALTPAQVSARAMLSAETAFNVAATAELDAKALGLLSGAKADQADKVRKDAYAALRALRSVYAQGGTPDLTGLLLLTNQLLILAGKAPQAAAVLDVPTL